MTDAYTAYVPACELVLQGRHVRITGGENVTISAGTQGTTREDLIVVRYTSDATTAVETVSLVVKQGASSDTDVDNSGSILDGATIADVPIAKVTITSLAPTATWLLPQLPTLKALGDSVSLMVKKFSVTGSASKGQTTDLHVDCKVDGWVPLLVAGVGSNHAGSFSINQAVITSDGYVYVTVLQPLLDWKSVTVNCTVLYAKSPFIVSREYI